MRFRMRIDPIWRPLLLLGGATRDNSFVEAGADSVTFQFGFLFTRTIPRSEIMGVESRHWPLIAGIGWRSTFRGVIGLIGSYDGVVEVRLAKRSRAWFIFPMDRICVSLEEPNGFMAALHTPSEPEEQAPEQAPTPKKQARKPSTRPRRASHTPGRTPGAP